MQERTALSQGRKEEHTQPEQHPLQPLVFLEHARTLTGLAALAVYGIVRTGLDAYYGALGLRTEDVGVTQAEIITRAALAFIYAIVIGAVLAALVAPTLSSRLRILRALRMRMQPLRGTTTADQGRIFWVISYALAWAGVVTLGLFLFASTLLSRAELFPFSGPIIAIAVSLLLTWLLVKLIRARASKIVNRLMSVRVTPLDPLSTADEDVDSSSFDMEERDSSSMEAAGLESFVLTVLVWSITLTLVLVFAVPYASGQMIAADVKAGKPYTPQYLVGLPSLGSLDVRADCVMVRNKADGKVVDEEIAPRRVLYLGHDSDFLILYQPGIGPLRLPSGDFILSTVRTAKC